MMGPKFFFLLSFLVLCALGHLPLTYNTPKVEQETKREDEEKLPIVLSIYYESLCPDSHDFFEHQLIPLFQLLKGPHDSAVQFSEHGHLDKLVDIQLIPYGKAVTIVPGSGSTSREHRFVCHHGPIECEGNKLHSCTLDAFTRLTPLSSSHNKLQLLKFLSCTMRFLVEPSGNHPKVQKRFRASNLTTFTSGALEVCFEQFASDPGSTKSPELENLKSTIGSCIHNSDHSSQLLKVNGELTKSLQPRMYWVPWVTYNGKWTKNFMDLSRKDLKEALCTLAPSNSQYSNFFECHQYGVGVTEKLPPSLQHGEVIHSKSDGLRGARGIPEEFRNIRMQQFSPLRSARFVHANSYLMRLASSHHHSDAHRSSVQDKRSYDSDWRIRPLF